MEEATLFKFGKWVEYDEKFPLKGAWSGSRDPFKNFKPPSIFLEWIHSLNLASGLTMANPTPRDKNFFLKGTWSGLPDRFGIKPR